MLSNTSFGVLLNPVDNRKMTRFRSVKILRRVTFASGHRYKHDFLFLFFYLFVGIGSAKISR